jgi:hypothetical protein
MYKLFSLFLVLVFTVFMQSCQRDDMAMSPQISESSGGEQIPNLAKNIRATIWADGELFETFGTPTEFHADNGPFDILVHGNFKDGIGAIAESKPGDRDFNGGRWNVYDPKTDLGNKYDNADSFEDLDLNDFEASGLYFECPMLPLRGNN